MKTENYVEIKSVYIPKEEQPAYKWASLETTVQVGETVFKYHDSLGTGDSLLATALVLDKIAAKLRLMHQHRNDKVIVVK